MGITLDNFKANIGTYLRANRFSVRIDGNIFNLEDMYTCKGSSLPGKSFGEVELSWQGYKYKIATDPQFNDITFHFYNTVDKNGKGIRDKFEKWMNQISDETTQMKDSHANYKWDVYIEQLDGKGNVIKTYVLRFAHPKEVSDIELSMDSTDQVEEFTVVFSYSFFEVV